MRHTRHNTRRERAGRVHGDKGVCRAACGHAGACAWGCTKGGRQTVACLPLEGSVLRFGAAGPLAIALRLRLGSCRSLPVPPNHSLIEDRFRGGDGSIFTAAPGFSGVGLPLGAPGCRRGRPARGGEGYLTAMTKSH